MKYVDLSIKPSGCEGIEALVNRLMTYGYRVTGINAELIDNCRIKSPTDIEIVARLEVKENGLTKIKKIKKKPGQILVVETSSLSVFRQLANMRNVDVIRVHPNMAKYLDKSQANLLYSKNKVVELSLPQYLSSKNGLFKFSIAIRRMYGYDIPFALVSDSEKPEQVWHPRMVRGVLSLLGIPEPYNYLPISSYPLRVVEKLVLSVKK